jgi:hypothetical protein
MAILIAYPIGSMEGALVLASWDLAAALASRSAYCWRFQPRGHCPLPSQSPHPPAPSKGPFAALANPC